MKLPVHVRMFPEELAAVDAFAAELRQQRSGAAFSRAEALRSAVLEWRKARQASGADPGGPHGRGDAGAPACRGAPGHRPPPGDGRQCAAWLGAAGAGPQSARPLCGDGAGARGGALRRRARPPVLRTHPLVASLDELPPTVTRGEETTPACEGGVRDDHPSTHAPPLLATRSHTVSRSQSVCWECPDAVGRSMARRVSKVDSGRHEPGEASQRESMEMLGRISALR